MKYIILIISFLICYLGFAQKKQGGYSSYSKSETEKTSWQASDITHLLTDKKSSLIVVETDKKAGMKVYQLKNDSELKIYYFTSAAARDAYFRHRKKLIHQTKKYTVHVFHQSPFQDRDERVFIVTENPKEKKPRVKSPEINVNPFLTRKETDERQIPKYAKQRYVSERKLKNSTVGLGASSIQSSDTKGNPTRIKHQNASSGQMAYQKSRNPTRKIASSKQDVLTAGKMQNPTPHLGNTITRKNNNRMPYNNPTIKMGLSKNAKNNPTILSNPTPSLGNTVAKKSNNRMPYNNPTRKIHKSKQE